MIDWTTLSHFHFIRPSWLWLMVPILLTAIYFVRQKPAKPNYHQLIAPHLLNALIVKSQKRLWISARTLNLILLIILVVALAGPTWQREVSPLVQDEAALIVAIDLSKTMSQTDVQPSRLERAKQKARDLVDLRGSARTAVLVFSATAHQLLPLSNDPDVIHQFISALKPGIMPMSSGSGRKQPEAIIPLLDTLLQNAQVPASILLMSDGVSDASAETLVPYFKQSDHQLLVLGVGLVEREPVNNSDNVNDGVLFDDIHIPLQQKALKKLATRTGGYYQAITADKQDLRRVSRQIDQHLSTVDDQARPWKDAGYYLLLPLCLMVLWLFRRGWLIQFFCLLLVVGFTPDNQVYAQSFEERSNTEKLSQAFLGLWLSDDQLGRHYFEQGEYSQAAHCFENPMWKGIAFYYDEKFDAAAEMFKQDDSPMARFNYANALAQGQHYVRAVAAYTLIIDSAPNHSAALANRQIVQDIIDAINGMSASQQAEPGANSKDLEGAPQRGDGADQNDIADPQQETLTAQQVLTDAQIREMWMKRVHQDPARFLAAKFQLQLNKIRDRRSQAEGNSVE